MARLTRSFVLVTVAGLFLAGWPGTAAAQGIIGIGPRVSFVRGDVTTNTPSTRLLGGTLRIKASPRVAVEGTIDYRSSTSLDGTQRVKETPIQGSLFLYPVRTTISPYLLAGIGVYTETTDTLSTTGAVTATSTTKKTGWHAGFGGELAFGQKKHVALFADYRYRFVSLGGNGTAVIPGVNLLKITHQGSMWTGGMVFYF